MPAFKDKTDRVDRGCLRAIVRGKRQAFEQLYERYRLPLFGYFLRMVSDPCLAEELVSDVLVLVWERADRFRGDSRVSTWIFGMAHHKAVDALRRRRLPLSALEAASQVVDPGDGPAEAAELGERREALRGALARLSPAHREVLELAFYQEFSYAEIAHITRVPENTVKTRVFHAKRKLRPVLEHLGILP